MAMLRFNAGKAPLSLVPTAFFEAIFNIAFDNGDGRVPTKLLWQVGQVLGFGAEKYSAHNWRKGGSWSSVLDSALRHTIWLIQGRRVDPESGLSEAGHLGCNIAFLLEFANTSTGEDDRFTLSTNLHQYIRYHRAETPDLVQILDNLLAYRDGGDVELLRMAAYDLACWTEAQPDVEPEPASPPPTPANDDEKMFEQVMLPFSFPAFGHIPLQTSVN